MEYEFEVEGTIIGKERPRLNINSGIIYTPGRTKDYELLVQQSFRVKYPRFKQIEGRVKVDIISYMKIPKQTSKAKRQEMIDNKISPTRKPDIDNIAKVILDAMNKYIIQDDTQVSKISVEKRYGEIDKVYVKIEEY